MSRPPIGNEGTGGGPAGIPIGRALVIRPGIANDDLQEAVSAIERVHGDGTLPTIPMTTVQALFSRDGHRLDGRFLYDITDHEAIAPIAIQMRSGAIHRRLVALHETGHLLDASGLPGSGFASGDLSVAELDGWREAVRSSHSVHALIALSDSDNPDVRRNATGLLQFEELWARSYAQFVATRSADPILRAELEAVRGEDAVATLYSPRQWNADDFTPIATAIQALFRILGWMD